MATNNKKKTNEVENLKSQYDPSLADSTNEDPAKSLWDSLSYGYGKKADEINKSYDKAISQQDNAMLKRGMGRSSYAAQSMANLNTERVNALASNEDAMIADWQNRLTEMQEAEKARQFQTSEREAQQSWQSGENALSRAFQTSEREGQQAWQSGENALSRAFQTSEREAQQEYQSGENALSRAFQTSEREGQQAWQSAENALNRAQEQEQFEKNFGLSQQQFEEGVRQYEKNFGYQEGRDVVADTQWEKNYEEAKSEYERSQTETERSNKAQEEYNKLALEETIRSNKENEYINWAKIDAEYGDHSASSGSSGGSGSYSGKSGSTGDGTEEKSVEEQESDLAKSLGFGAGDEGSGQNSTVAATASVDSLFKSKENALSTDSKWKLKKMTKTGG